MTIVQHFALYLSRLLGQYKGLLNLQAVLEVSAGEAQAIETSLQDLFDKRDLDNATGAQLDVIGRILNSGRELLETDTDYRARLKLLILVYASGGTPEELIEIFDRLTEPDFIEYRELVFAEFSLMAINPTGSYSNQDVRNFILRAKPAGVGATDIAFASTPAFAFAGDADPNKAGFGDTGFPAVGGKFASLY